MGEALSLSLTSVYDAEQKRTLGMVPFCINTYTCVTFYLNFVLLGFPFENWIINFVIFNFCQFDPFHKWVFAIERKKEKRSLMTFGVFSDFKTMTA